MSSIYRVGLGEAEDGTWKRGGRNITEHGHIVIQKLIIGGNIKAKEDVPEPVKGDMGFNRDTFTYIPAQVSGTAVGGSGSIIEGDQSMTHVYGGGDTTRTIFTTTDTAHINAHTHQGGINAGDNTGNIDVSSDQAPEE